MLLLKDLFGNSRVKKNLEALLTLKQKPQAFLFEGPTGVGKAHFAKAFANELILKGNHDSDATCKKLSREIHPDIRYSYPEGKTAMHSMQSIQSLIDESRLDPFESHCKVLIIFHADRMLLSGSNALLKTLEEPHFRTFIFLVTSRKDLLLPTVVSRLFKISFSEVEENEICRYLKVTYQKTDEEAKNIALMSHGQLAYADALVSLKKDLLVDSLIQACVSAFQQNYGELSSFLGKLEEEITTQKEHERAGSFRVDSLFLPLFYWYRDLHLIKSGGDTKRLFFKHYRQELQGVTSFELPSLEKVHRQLLIAQEAVSTHIKWRCVLEQFFLSLHFV